MRRVLTGLLVIGAGLLVWGMPLAAQAPTIPERLGDREFWALSEQMSEPSGYFGSENLVSNERTYQYVVPALLKDVRPGGVYLGVAPDQNFTYILATRPRIAFILDIRRGNLLQHLMYKALIELSPDRATFVSRLFSKPRPAGLDGSATPRQMAEAFRKSATSESFYRANLRAIRDRLLVHHRFPLSADDLEQLESIYFAFFWDGPGLRYSNTQGGVGRGGANFPTWEDLVLQTDSTGVPRGYLASEAQFQALKRMEERNLIVPVVGNFAGPKALRSVARYIRARRGAVTAFYVSNVEQYLFQDGVFEAFARNVSALPADPTGVFIRSVSIRYGYRGDGLGFDGRASALQSIPAFVRDFEVGGIVTYADVNSRSQ